MGGESLPAPPDPPVLNPWTETVTGRQRLKAMITFNTEFWEDYKPFCRECKHLVMATFVCTGMLGSIVAMRRTKLRWSKDNRLTIFDNQFKYFYQLQGHLVLGAINGGLRTGLDGAGAVGTVVLTHAALYAYQNRVSFWNVWPSLIAWGMYMKALRGFRRICLGAVRGAVLGLPVAAAFTVFLLATKENERRRLIRDEARYQRYLEAVWVWRQDGTLLSPHTRHRYESHITAPRPWHTDQQNAESLQYRQLPPPDDYDDFVIKETLAEQRRQDLLHYSTRRQA